MTTDSTAGDRAAPGQTVDEPPTLWGAMLGHKRAAAAVIALLLAAIAVTVATAVSSSSASASALTDATTCSAWTSASHAQQSAYSQLYLAEHLGSAGGARYVRAITSALDADCTQAAYLGESDDISLVAAIKREY
jgi:hypothetical protein